MANRVVINTRPFEDSRRTSLAFEKQGFRVFEFPCIEIERMDLADFVIQDLKSLDLNDVLIFTSQNAVKFAFSLVSNWAIPKKAQVIAVGTKTAACFKEMSHHSVVIPQQQNSLGVIDLLIKMSTGKSIKLITGLDGRNEIQKYASIKQIDLVQVNVYQRQLPCVDSKALKQLKGINKCCTLAFSVSALENLQQLVSSDRWLHLMTQPLACVSSRVQGKARQMGFTQAKNYQTANPNVLSKQLHHLNKSFKFL